MMTQHDDIGGGWVGLVGLFGQMDLVGLVGLVIAGGLSMMTQHGSLVSQPTSLDLGTSIAIAGPLNDDPT